MRFVKGISNKSESIFKLNKPKVYDQYWKTFDLLCKVHAMPTVCKKITSFKCSPRLPTEARIGR